MSHRATHRRDDDLRDVEVEPALDEQRRCTGCHRIRSMRVTVLDLTGDGAEQPPRAHLSAVVGDIEDLDVATVRLGITEERCQTGETRGHGAPRTFGGPEVLGAGAHEA